MKCCVAVRLWLSFLTLFSLSFEGLTGLFLKHSSGKCVRSAETPHLSTNYAKIWYLELASNCTVPEAQFRFINQGVLQHVDSTGCVLPLDGKESPAVGSGLVVFAAKDVCSNDSSNAYTQTHYGSLRHASGKCIQPRTSFTSTPSEGAKIEFTSLCNKTLQHFLLGSITCEGNIATDINCPPSQVIKTTKANYGGYGSIKTCGYNRNYNCLLPSALCLVRRSCDGRQNCQINVTTDEFEHDACPGMKKYFYVEYSCIQASAFRKESIKIKKVRLASTTKPGEGYIEVLEVSKPNTWKRLCVEDLKDDERAVVCRTLGYSGLKQVQSSVGSGQGLEGSDEVHVLHANIYCNSQENNVSSCCLEKGKSEESSCATMAHVSCAICSEPVLSSEHNPGIAFSASSSLPGHFADQADMTSGSAWCARDMSTSRDFLKVDLAEAYVITQLAILGDDQRGHWVAEYELLYSMNNADWLPGISKKQNRLTGNIAADQLSTAVLDIAIHARFIKIFPKSWHGLPCLKLEICGHKLFPGAPINLTLRTLTSYSADLTWIRSNGAGDGPFTQYQISLFQGEKLIFNITTETGSWYFATLTPYTEYTVTVQAGNNHGYGQKAQLTFATASAVPTAAPLDIKLASVSSSSISISWKPPPLFHRNGIITGYEVCFSRVKSNERCDNIIRTNATSAGLGFLSPATEYKVKVLARNNAGSSNYSEEYFQITNEEAAVCNLSSVTSDMFVIKLQKPREEVRFCQVVVLALPPEDNFSKYYLYSVKPGTYLDASDSSLPYITGEFRASHFEKYQDFAVGDGTIFSALSAFNTNKNQAKKYFNGPLSSKTRYTAFQRFLSDKKVLYTSDSLTPVWTKEADRPETNFSDSLVRPSSPPQGLQISVQSSTSINVSWKSPILENRPRITGYQVCIAHVQSEEECDVIVRTKASACVISGLKSASRYKVRVSARNKVGYGKYGKDYITITNAKAPIIIPSKITEESFVAKLHPPTQEIRFCQIVLIILPANGRLPKPFQFPENYNSYYDAKASAQPSSYIAAEFDAVEFEKYQEFTVGDGGVSLGVVGMSMYGKGVRKYFNGPLSSDTMYTVFGRFYNEQNLLYISDFLSPVKTRRKDNIEKTETQRTPAKSKASEKDVFKVPFILVIALLVIVLLVFGVIVIHRRRVRQNDVPRTTEKTFPDIRGSWTIAQTEHESEQKDITSARI